jgi:hypothetical protein
MMRDDSSGEDSKKKRGTYVLPTPRYERERYVVREEGSSKSSRGEEVRRKLAHYGVAVVPNAISEEAVARTLTGLWSTLETTFPDFKRAEPSTWRALRDNGAKHGMLLQTHGLGWSQPVVDVRQDPQLVALFAELWTVKPEALASSADGLSVYLNTRDSKGGWHRPVAGEWLHWDRAPNDETPSIQGFVNLLPTAEHGAAFQVLTKSHRRQAEFAAQFPHSKSARFYLLDGQEEADFFLKSSSSNHVCIAAEPRDLVLWDSRTIHCGRAASRAAELLERVVIYTSMQPREWLMAASEKLGRERKKRAHAQLRSTSHNAAVGVELFPVYPRVRCAEDEARKKRSRPITTPPVLTALGRSLFSL